MPDKKKQHYVPQFYMRLFANEFEKFSLLNLNNKAIFSNVPCNNQCYDDYFYGEDGTIEQQLGQLEAKWANIIKEAKNNLNLDEEHISSLKEFSIYQLMRTEAEYNHKYKINRELYIEQAKSFASYKNIPFNDEVKNELLKNYEDKASPTQNVEWAKDLVKYIDDLQLLTIHYETKTELISSDTPVIAFNPFHKFSVGAAVIGLIIIFPISPFDLIVLYDSGIYKKNTVSQHIESNNEEEVRMLNMLQFLSAEKTIYCYRPQELSTFTDDDYLERDKNRNRP